MPRPITLTKEMKQQLQKDFTAMLDGIQMLSGKLSYTIDCAYKDRSAIISLTPDAYRKIVTLVTEFQSEVAWHGSVSRVGDNEFIIEDIFVYPQEATRSTVNTNQNAYTQWLYGLDEDTFSKLRMHGHSHVNMGVSPSVTDDTHRQKITDQLEVDTFYIFMIWNKSLSTHALIYDMTHNIFYEDADIEVKLLGGDDVDEFLADAKEKVTKPVSKFKVTSSSTKPVSMTQQEDTKSMLDLHDPYDLGGAAWRT